MTTLDDAVAQMRAEGMPSLPEGHPIADGKIHRFGPKKKSWYVLRENILRSGKVIVSGSYGTYQGDDPGTLKVRAEGEELNEQERAEMHRQRAEQERKQQEDEERKHRLAANRAKVQWAEANGDEAVVSAHPYLLHKHVRDFGLRVAPDGLLFISLRAEGGRGDLVGLQKIDPSGDKKFNHDINKVGAGCWLQAPSGDEWTEFAGIQAIGEGYATCASVRMAVDIPVTMALDAGNIIHVARHVRAHHPNDHILFLADDDYQLQKRFVERLASDFKVNCGAEIEIDGLTHDVAMPDGSILSITPFWRDDANGVRYLEADVRSERFIRQIKFENAGLSRCAAAAKEVGNASVVFPVFENRHGEKWTDFNDLHVVQSLDAVASQIFAALDRALAPVVEPEPVSVTEDAFTQAAQQLHDNALPALPHEAEPPAPTGAAAPQFEGVPVFDDSPPPPSEVVGQAELFAEGEGVEKQLKEKPKKVYGREHWAAVEDALDNFILIYGEDMVWDCRQRMLMKISSMRTIISNSDVMKFWSGNARKWVLKRNIVFDPTETPSPAVTGPTATVNLFSGWKMQPKQGECLQIQTLLAHLVDGNEDMYQWILRWLAYPLRHRGAKMETSIIMHGDEGSGKNFFFEKVIKAIYGEYGYVIGNAQLESQFNDWASMKLFMVADEVVTRSELRHMKGKLKYLVSGDTIIVNPKGLPEHSEANHINFVFLSNELQPLALDKTDRRYLVIWTPPALPREFYVGVADEIRNGGIEAFYHHLMYEVDMGDFDEHTKPLYNEAKDNLIEKSLTPSERFYREWSGGFLPLPFITCGATQLFDAFKTWCDRSGESRFISQTLFGTQLARYAGAALVKKLIKYELGEVVKQRWVFLVGEKPEAEKTLADWVAGAANLFEGALKKYRGRGGAMLDGADDSTS